MAETTDHNGPKQVITLAGMRTGQIPKTIELFDRLYVIGGRENAACFTYALCASTDV